MEQIELGALHPDELEDVRPANASTSSPSSSDADVEIRDTPVGEIAEPVMIRSPPPSSH